MRGVHGGRGKQRQGHPERALLGVVQGRVLIEPLTRLPADDAGPLTDGAARPWHTHPCYGPGGPRESIQDDLDRLARPQRESRPGGGLLRRGGAADRTGQERLQLDPRRPGPGIGQPERRARRGAGTAPLPAGEGKEAGRGDHGNRLAGHRHLGEN